MATDVSAEIDARTIAAARRGDSDAFIAVLRHYDQRLRLVAYRVVGDRSLMDDALQEVAIKAARALPELRDPEALGAWLCRVTYTTCIDLLRRERGLVLMAPEDLPEPTHTGADEADELAGRDAAARALAALPPEQRAAVILVDQVGLDYATTAEILGIPSGTVASRLAHARAVLRTTLTSSSDLEVQS